MRSLLHRYRHLALMALAGGLLLAGGASCSRGVYPFSQGAYPVDIFNEMHYQQAYRSQEPPRLYPPEGAVPVTGTGQAVWLPEDRDAAAALADKVKNPLRPTEEVLARGRRLYEINCAMCHGQDGKGGSSTFVGRKFLDALLAGRPAAPPADLTSDYVQNQADVLLFHTITYGRGAMKFRGKNLLSEEERWAIIAYIRTLK